MSGHPARSQKRDGRFTHCMSPEKETTEDAHFMTELDDAVDQPAGEYSSDLLREAAETLWAIKDKIPRNVSPEKILDEATRELGAPVGEVDPTVRQRTILRAARRLILGSAHPDINLGEVIASVRRQLKTLIQEEIAQFLADPLTVWPNSRQAEALRQLPKVTCRRLMAKDRLMLDHEPLPDGLIADLVNEVISELRGLHHQHFLRTEVTRRFGAGSSGERLGHRIINSLKNQERSVRLDWPAPFSQVPEPIEVPRWMDELQGRIDRAKTSGWVLWGLFEKLIIDSNSSLKLEELTEVDDWTSARRDPDQGKLRSSDLQNQADAMVAAAIEGSRWWNRSSLEVQELAESKYREQLTEHLARILTLDLLFEGSARLPGDTAKYTKQLEIQASKKIKAERLRREKDVPIAAFSDTGLDRAFLEYLNLAQEFAEETYINSLPDEFNFDWALEKDLPGASVRLVLLCQGYPSSLTAAQSRVCAHALMFIEALKDTFNTDTEAVERLRHCWFSESWPIPKHKSYRVLQELNPTLPFDIKRLTESGQKAFRRLVLGDGASTGLSQLGSGRLVRKALPTVSALLDRVRSLRAAAAERSGEHGMSRHNPETQGEAE